MDQHDKLHIESREDIAGLTASSIPCNWCREGVLLLEVGLGSGSLSGQSLRMMTTWDELETAALPSVLEWSGDEPVEYALTFLVLCAVYRYPRISTSPYAKQEECP